MRDGDFVALEELESLAGRLLADLDAAGRRDILRAIARDLKSSQAHRIGKNQNPDGSKFAKRRERKQARPGLGARRFLYPSGGSGSLRVVFMKSWAYDGPLMTGYDIEAEGIRSFETKKIKKFLGVRPDEENGNAVGGAIRSRTTIRKKAMFRKLKSGRYLKSGNDDYGLWVGFLGDVARIAGVHQLGQRDRVSRNGPSVQYPTRELLGFTAHDREHILDIVIGRLAV